MAAPFTNLKNDYQKLIEEQIIKITKEENVKYIREILKDTYQVEKVPESAKKTQVTSNDVSNIKEDQVKKTQAAVKKPTPRPKAFKKYPIVDFRKFFSISPMEPEQAFQNVNLGPTQPMVMKLQVDPYDLKALESLEDFFKLLKMKRQAKYFEDRITDAKAILSTSDKFKKDGEKR